MDKNPITYEELPEEHKKKYDELKALFEADLLNAFERTRKYGIRFKGFYPEGALDGVDLALPSEERTQALRQEVNYMVAHSMHRYSESLVNTLERIAVRVVQEIMKHQHSPTGPTLGTHQGEASLYTRPQLPFQLAAPEPQGSPAYVVYKVGGDPGDCQFLQEPPKEVPHGYVCAYVPDSNVLARTNQTATAGELLEPILIIGHGWLGMPRDRQLQEFRHLMPIDRRGCRGIPLDRHMEEFRQLMPINKRG